MASSKQLPGVTPSPSRLLLGEALQDLRLRAELKTDSFIGHPAALSSQMIRMIEKGWAKIPIAKMAAYASILSSRASVSGVSVDSNNLALACASLLSWERGAKAFSYIDWDGLCEEPIEGKKTLIERLTTASSDRGLAPITDSGGLNPIQEQLVLEIAKRVRIFGSEVVSDSALSAWEEVNLHEIVRVRAIVTTLASEFADDFFTSIFNLLTHSGFERLEYLVAANTKRQLDDAVEALRNEIAHRADGLTTIRPSILKSLIEKKLQCERITQEQFAEIEKAIRDEKYPMWDGFYLYERRSGPSLLFGVFRRFSTSLLRKEPSLREWNAVAMNETLPRKKVDEFRNQHQSHWRLIRGQRS